MIKFGTGCWRAVIGDEFTKKNIQLLAQAMCNKMKAEGKTDKGMIIGYDKRFLSKEAMRWMGQVFAAQEITTSVSYTHLDVYKRQALMMKWLLMHQR